MTSRGVRESIASRSRCDWWLQMMTVGREKSSSVFPVTVKGFPNRPNRDVPNLAAQQMNL